MTWRTHWARLFARARRVRYAVATGGDASWRLEARRRRSPARAKKRRRHRFGPSHPTQGLGENITIGSVKS